MTSKAYWKRRHMFVLLLLGIVLVLASSGRTVYAKKQKAKKRYIVTSNYRYDNAYNTYGQYTSLKNAKKAVRKQPKYLQGEWFIYDRKERKVVWPDLSTTKKKIRKAVAWAKAISHDNAHGYTCVGENTKTNLKKRWGRWGRYGDYSCSTIVTMAYELVGLVNLRDVAKKKNVKMKVLGRTIKPGLNSTSLGKIAKASHHFKSVSSKMRKKGSKALKPGDILITYPKEHVAMYIGGGRIVEARTNERGSDYAPYPYIRPGDQTGREIRVSVYDPREWFYAFRPC